MHSARGFRNLSKAFLKTFRISVTMGADHHDVTSARTRWEAILRELGPMVIAASETPDDLTSLLKCLEAIVANPRVASAACLHICNVGLREACTGLVDEYRSIWKRLRENLDDRAYEKATRGLHRQGRLQKKLALGALAFLGALATGAGGYLAGRSNADARVDAAHWSVDAAQRAQKEAEKSQQVAEKLLQDVGLSPEEAKAMELGVRLPAPSRGHHRVAHGAAWIMFAYPIPFIFQLLAYVRNLKTDEREAVENPAKNYLYSKLYKERHSKYKKGILFW